MDTKFWGPPGWVFLHTITFNYPWKIDPKNAEHRERKKYTRQLFENLQYTLPCKYCRASFKQFLKELPIEPHLGSRRSLTRWLYEMHNKVNAKLRKQEMEAVEALFANLEAKVVAGHLSKRAAYKQLKEFVEKTMITDPDPSFAEICARYEAHRAGCSKEKHGLAVCR
jgi:hypothetical protein